MYVVIKLNTYMGDGCDAYGFSGVMDAFGPFDSFAAAQTYVDSLTEEYTVEYSIQRMVDPT